MQTKKTTAFILGFFLAATCTACSRGAGSGTVTDVAQLRGKVVYNIGQGQPPDFVFRYILKRQGIEYAYSDTPVAGKVALAYAQNGVAVSTLLEAGTADYGIMAEPDATEATKKIRNSRIMLDLQRLYSQAAGFTGGYPQACLVVKKSFLQAHPRYVAEFAAAIRQGENWATENPEAALVALRKQGSTTVQSLTTDVVRRCNIRFVAARDAQEAIAAFFAGITETVREGEINPLGGTLPDEGFYGSLAVDAPTEVGVRAKVFVPDGAPALALASLIAQKHAADIAVVPPAQIGVLTATQADIAVLPTTAAAVQYNKSGAIVALGVVTFGNLYLLGRTYDA